MNLRSNSFEKSKSDILDTSKKFMSLSTSSQGFLFKWQKIIDGDIYYYKTGEIIRKKIWNVQTFNEVICSRLGKEMGVNCVEYTLERTKINRPDILLDSEIYVCKSKNFLDTSRSEQMYTFTKLLNTRRIGRDTDIYKLILEKYPCIKESLDEMILFDFIINNEDRHLNNFGIIEDIEGNKRLTPLFDNGSSFCWSLEDYDIENSIGRLINREDWSKPFRTHHKKQIKLIDTSILYKYNFNIDIEKLFKGFEKLYSEQRLMLMKAMLKARLSYVRNM